MPDDKRGPRFTVDVPPHVRAQMEQAGDGIAHATRARLLLQLWAEDPGLQRRVRQAHQATYRLRNK